MQELRMYQQYNECHGNNEVEKNGSLNTTVTCIQIYILCCHHITLCSQNKLLSIHTSITYTRRETETKRENTDRCNKLREQGVTDVLGQDGDFMLNLVGHDKLLYYSPVGLTSLSQVHMSCSCHIDIYTHTVSQGLYMYQTT